MRTRRIAWIVAALAFVTVGCNQENTAVTNNSQPAAISPSASSAAKPTDELAAARENFQKHCAACHGVTGEGGVVQIEGKSLKVPSLKTGHAVGHTDEKLVKQVLNGGEGMPAFKDKLSMQEAADLVKYIRREFQQK
jgi:mono/diheme cytochrome c family protein